MPKGKRPSKSSETKSTKRPIEQYDHKSKLARNLKAEIDPDLIEHYRGTTSLPFALGDHKRVAIKVIDDRGIESLKVLQL